MNNAQVCIDELKKLAEKGDSEAVKTLIQLTRHEQEEELRKDLFGI